LSDCGFFITFATMKDISVELDIPFHYLKKEDFLDTAHKAEGLIPLNGIMLVAVCNNGHVTVDIDGRVYEVVKHDIFVLAPSSFAHVIEISDDFDATLIHFDFDFYSQIANGVLDMSLQIYMSSQLHKSLSDSQYDLIMQLMQSVYDRIMKAETEFLNTPSQIRDTRGTVLRELLISMGRSMAYEILNVYMANVEFETRKLSRQEAILREFFTAVYEHYKEHRELAYYADKLFLSPRYLASIVKKTTGKTPSEWITERVMSDAKQLLAYSEKSIKQISQELNFPNQSFFGKYFRHQTGLSPLEYRRKRGTVS